MARSTSPKSTVLPYSAWEKAPVCDDKTGFAHVEVLSNLRQANLTNPIHSIWHEARFPQSDFGEYRFLDQPLRLATHYLEASAPMFAILLQVDPFQIPSKQEAGPNGKGVYIFDNPPEQLTHEQRHQLDEKLTILGQCLHNFGVEDLNGPDAVCRTVHRDAQASKIVAGFDSRIVIDRHLYHEYLASYHNRDADIPRYQYLSCNIAACLIHELAHVAQNMHPLGYNDAHPKQQQNHFFLGDKAKTSEVGMQVESYLFGGVRPNTEHFCSPQVPLYVGQDGQSSKFDGIMSVTTEPDPLTLDQYLDHNEVLTRGERPRYGHYWNTSFLHWAQFLQDEFWNGKYLRVGRRALHPILTTGLRVDCQTRESKWVNQGIEGLPSGFWADENGLMMPIDDYIAGTYSSYGPPVAPLPDDFTERLAAQMEEEFQQRVWPFQLEWPRGL